MPKILLPKIFPEYLAFLYQPEIPDSTVSGQLHA